MREAMLCADADDWYASVMDEINSWLKLEVFEEVDIASIPAGQRPIGSKIVFKLKLDKENRPIRYKARIVARGFQQQDLDTIETFPPMAHPVTIRTIIALAVSEGWYLKQSDVKTAYLNSTSTLEEPLYLLPPKGLPDVPEGKCWKLRKAVYRLGIAGHRWWECFSERNKQFSLTAIMHDNCVFSIT